MSDLAARVLVVLGLVAIAGGVVWAIRRRIQTARVPFQQALLGPGIYLFTSVTCSGCEPARRDLIEVLGLDGFEEFSWESHPRLFEDLDITAVPATLVVDDSRHSTLYPGLQRPPWKS
jgi:hypothetical protein